MEAFSFLKFWRTAGNSAAAYGIDYTKNYAGTNNCPVAETDNVIEEEESFFELEFTLLDGVNKEESGDKYKDGEKSNYDEDRELNFALSSHDLISKRRILPVLEPTSKPQSPISILKSAPRLRVFMLRSKKLKTEKTEENSISKATPQRRQESQLFGAKFVEESPGIKRENSLRDLDSKLQKKKPDDESSKRFSKDVIQKYLKLIKPLYVKVSKRYTDKLDLSDLYSTASPVSSPVTVPSITPKKPVRKKEEAGVKQGSIPAGLRVVCKHLGKSRSASAAVGTVSPASSRRDDSLLQQHDGIQSAILHCKKSFNSSKESPLLSRSTSDPSQEILIVASRKSTGEENAVGF